jgi:hypothetical protein
MLKPIIKLTVLALGIVSVIGASKLGAEENKTAIAADRISLFSVPLRCEAAPDIGCGPISKPILLQLEREPARPSDSAQTVKSRYWLITFARQS